jgi:hypothetical protein
MRGHPGRALTLASWSSDLIVVGGRRNQAQAKGLGPVTCAMLQHAQCPVAIIPGSALPWADAANVMGGAGLQGDVGDLAYAGLSRWLAAVPAGGSTRPRPRTPQPAA